MDISSPPFVFEGIFSAVFSNGLYMLAYGLVAALIMSIALGILVKVWDWLTPVNEWEELKKGNIAVAIVLAAVIIGFAIVVSAAITPNL